MSTILESNVILPKNPEKAANKPETTENFSPAIFSMKISQVRFSLHKIIFHEINQYNFFFLTGGLLTFYIIPQRFQMLVLSSYRTWSKCYQNSQPACATRSYALCGLSTTTTKYRITNFFNEYLLWLLF